MTIDRETVIRLAREAGIFDLVVSGLLKHVRLERFAALVLEHGRKPLSRERVRELLREAGYSGAQEKADFINGLRHGEIEHGITNKESSDAE